MVVIVIEIILAFILFLMELYLLLGFCGGSDGKESTCNVGDLGLTPGLGRSGEGNGYPPQYSFFFFFVVRFYLFISFIFISWRLITSQHCSGFCHTLTWISHGVTCIPHPGPPSHHPSILAWRTPWTKEPGRLHSTGSQRVGHDWGIFSFASIFYCFFCDIFM